MSVVRMLLLVTGIGATHLAYAALPTDPSVLVERTAEPVPAATTAATDPAIAAVEQVATAAQAPVTTSSVDTALPTDDAVSSSDNTPDLREAECMAKVIVHEAGNQPHVGQVAVAQVIRTRVRSGRFADTVCGVVKQRGQFFDVDSYHPPRTNGRWTTAMSIALETLRGSGEEVAPGALFFHSAGARMPSRVRIAQIADHTFYR